MILFNFLPFLQIVSLSLSYCFLIAGYDINKLFQEAQSRWLKSAEVFFVLQNYDKHHLNLKPPENPQSNKP